MTSVGMTSPKSKSATAAATTGDEDLHQPKRVVMRPEELEKTAERLYGHSSKKMMDRQKEFEAAVNFQATHNVNVKARKAEPTAEEAKALERLYSQPMEKKKRSLEAAEQKQAAQAPTSKKVTQEEVEQITDRVFAQAVRRKEQSMNESEKRAYGAQTEEKKLDKDQLQARVDSLFTKAIEKKNAKMEKLTEQHQWKVEKKTISKDQVAELANRLSAKK